MPNRVLISVMLLFTFYKLYAFDEALAARVYGVWSFEKAVNQYESGQFKNEPGLGPVSIKLSRDVFLGWPSSVLIDPFASVPFFADSGRTYRIIDLKDVKGIDEQITLVVSPFSGDGSRREILITLLNKDKCFINLPEYINIYFKRIAHEDSPPTNP